RGQPLVDPARGRADPQSDILEKGDNVVIRSFLYFLDAPEVKRGLLADSHGVGPGNRAKFGHRFAGKNFDLQPDLQLPLLAQKRAHLRQRITINHPPSVATPPRPMRLEIRDRATAKKTFIAIRRKRKFLAQPTEVKLARQKAKDSLSS